MFTGIPFALTGGIMALWLRGIPMSFPRQSASLPCRCGGLEWFGMMPLFVTCAKKDGLESNDSRRRHHSLATGLMTALVASLGFVPIACHRHQREVQRPLTVVIGGILSSTVLTLLVLPLLYQLAHRRDEENGNNAQTVPAWRKRLAFWNR